MDNQGHGHHLSTNEAVCVELNLEFQSSLLNYPFVKKNISLVPYPFIQKRRILPLMEQDETVWAALDDPFNLEAVEELSLLLKKNIHEIITTKEALDQAIELCFCQNSGATNHILKQIQQETEDKIESEEYEILNQHSASFVISLLNSVLSEAVYQKASDIHFEPVSDGLVVRYRIDGVLQKRHTVPLEFKASLISRIKVMAALDIAETRLPQDGRIKVKLAGKQIDFRVSTIAVSEGERVVLRILDKSNVILGLEKLGMPTLVSKNFEEMLKCNEGIILVTGPTGSGKTTTLYSAIKNINSLETNIMTIEDPVEYKLDHIAQMSVNTKINLNFATGLRHLLRQDPDVIMIGEIRDQETAEIAIQASLTGHLVLSTLHTNDAPSAMTRLIDMGIEPYLLSSSVIGVLAQRLIRANCLHCLELYQPKEEELHLLRLTDHDGPFYRGKGCPSCFSIGYQGRIALYELLVMTPLLKEAVLKTAGSLQLRQMALEQNMVSLIHSGILAVKAGQTTPFEVLRALRSYTRN